MADQTDATGSWTVGTEGPGTIIASKYVLDRIIGAGAIAVVYSAKHATLGGRVALKFLKPEYMNNAELVSRFRQEAVAVARLSNPHVATVTDLGEHDGVPFIAMEFLDGKDLRALLREQGPMPLAEVAEVLIQTCAALAAAHGEGIVHRDIKPDNLFLVDPERNWRTVKVLDFGISKVAEHLRDERAKFRTGDMQMIGSPHYMSPEQIKTPRDVDHRTDIWSLGVVAFELWTGGERPFVGPNLAILVASILSAEPRRPTLLAANADFLRIVERCLQKDPNARYQSAADLAAALFAFAPPRSAHTVERARHLTPHVQQSAVHAPPPRSLAAEQAERDRAAAVRARLELQRAPPRVVAPSIVVQAEARTMPIPRSKSVASPERGNG